MADILELQRAVHQNAVDHGFWEDAEQQNIPSKLMLTVAELAEALEEYRAGEMQIYRVPENPVTFAQNIVGKPEGFPIELADAVIRIMDLCGWLGIDLSAAIELKMAYNATRPHKHGKRV